MIEQLDAAIGRLLAALREHGRDRNTLVVFTADHGPLGPSARRKPLRGAKADLYEGGLRVPLLMRWPGKIQAGQMRDAPVSGADIFPTLVAAAGATAEASQDGFDLWPLIHDAQYQLPRSELYWHYPHYHHLGLGPSGAIRAGDYKLIEWFEPALHALGANGGEAYELFNLAADPGESRNLAGVETRRRDALLRKLRDWRIAVGAQSMTLNPVYDPTAPIRLLPPARDQTSDEGRSWRHNS
jgi:arylsulfatase A-like enzyme